MSWYLEKMEQLLSEEDKRMLKNIYAPKEVVVPPRDTYVFSSVMPDGEIRLYGGSVGRGKHQEYGLGGYLYSRDCGLSWRQHVGTEFTDQNGWGVRSPISGRYLQCLDDLVRIFEEGPDGFQLVKRVKLFEGRNKDYGCPKHPVFLEKKPGRCLATWHRDLEDGNFAPVVVMSDDDGETWKITELPTTTNSEIFYPDKGYRWRNRGSEPTLCELADGTLYLLSRTSTDFFNEYFSYDHGETWVGTGENSPIHGTLATPLLLRLHDGRTLLLWNNTRVMPRFNHHHLWPQCHYGHFVGELEDMFTNRDVANAAVSTDGKHWIGQREIALTCIRNDSDYRRAGGRHNIADKSVQQFEAWELPYNKVFVVMGQSISTRRGVIFDINWLLQDEREEDFSAGLSHVSTHQYVKSIRGSWFGHSSANRLPGAVLTADPENPERQVAQLARFHAPDLFNEKAGLVWNFPVSEKGEITVEMNILQSGVQICLSDHWQNPSAPDMKIAAATCFTLEKEDLPHSGWNTVRIRFDTVNKQVKIFADNGALLFEAPITLPLMNGFSYIHFQSLAEAEDLQGTLLRRLAKKNSEKL